MKRAALLASLVLVAVSGCDNSSSKLDGLQATPSAQPGGAQGGSLEERVRRLEENWAKHAEALDFLNKVYAQQKAQQAAQKREEHDPNAVFAVDIDQNVKLGMVEGPNDAYVTIVEAFDFA